MSQFLIFFTFFLCVYSHVSNISSIEHYLKKSEPKRVPNFQCDREAEVFLYAVMLVQKPVNEWLYSGAGWIFDERHIIAAAHCVVGGHNFGIIPAASFHKEQYENVVKVQNIVIHKRYNPSTLANDIAVLTLSQPLPKGKCVQYARLPGPTPPSLTWPRECEGTFFRYDWREDDKLWEASLQVLPTETCKATFKLLNLPYTGHEFCTESFGGQTSRYAAGAPVTCKAHKEGVDNFLVGMTTAQVDDNPSRYLRIEPYLKYIKEVIKAKNIIDVPSSGKEHPYSDSKIIAIFTMFTSALVFH